MQVDRSCRGQDPRTIADFTRTVADINLDVCVSLRSVSVGQRSRPRRDRGERVSNTLVRSPEMGITIRKSS